VRGEEGVRVWGREMWGGGEVVGRCLGGRRVEEKGIGIGGRGHYRGIVMELRRVGIIW
jgi:hypothetical protein